MTFNVGLGPSAERPPKLVYASLATFQAIPTLTTAFNIPARPEVPPTAQTPSTHLIPSALTEIFAPATPLPVGT